ncbi:MAG: hypothetical protein AABY33_06360 [Pseudomonadota bacterium]
MNKSPQYDYIQANFSSIQDRIDKLAKEYVTDSIINFMHKNDPALQGKDKKYVESVVPFYPSVLAIASHAEAHRLFTSGDKIKMIQAVKLAEAAHARTGIDIHPATKIGENFFADHGTGVVIGETAEIGNGTMTYHGVTLGAYGRCDTKNRHPKIGSDCVISVGAKVLGNIKVGDEIKIGPDSLLTGNNITIGNKVSISSSVTIDGGLKNSKLLTIGNNVSIGSSAKIYAGNTIIDNIKIGEGAVITANTGEIKQNIPAYSEVFRDKESNELKIVSLMENDKQISILQRAINRIDNILKVLGIEKLNGYTFVNSSKKTTGVNNGHSLDAARL